MLTVKAERRPVAKADYDAGVLTLRIPIAERAKPRKISIGVGSDRKEIAG
jgi:HSP20 family protein